MIIEPMSTRKVRLIVKTGHSSHCSSPKYATFKDYAIDEYREVKICDSCRCADCTKMRKKWKKNLEKYKGIWGNQ